VKKFNLDPTNTPVGGQMGGLFESVLLSVLVRRPRPNIRDAPTGDSMGIAFGGML
jgi:hypothetical protein